MKRKFYQTIFCGLLATGAALSSNAQVGIGTTTPHSSAMLDVTATDKGILIPRVNSLASVANPAEGVMVYLLGEDRFYFFTGSSWRAINPVTLEKDGSGNEKDVNLQTEKNVGINTWWPKSKLSVNGNLAVGTNYATYQGDGAGNPFPPVNGALIEGKVGIGTTNTNDAMLTVQGNTKVIGDLNNSGRITSAGDITVNTTGSFIGRGTIPVGGIIMWSGPTDGLPDGWALCNGQTSSGFTTPDLQGRFIIGAGTRAEITRNQSGAAVTGNNITFNIKTTGGYDKVAIAMSEMPLHNHNVVDSGHVHSYKDLQVPESGNKVGNGEQRQVNWNIDAIRNTVKSSADIRQDDRGSNAAHDNTPTYYVLAYIIRVK